HYLPVRSRMALNDLAIPAIAMSIEFTFSKLCHICTEIQSSVGARTICGALLTKHCTQNGLILV
ncbi:hypothetical protein FA13DRAFT_1641659, partial [Coprinellus micaceus]